MFLGVALIVVVIPTSAIASSSKTQTWIEVLQSDSSLQEKARACQRLGEFGGEDAIPALAALLDHPQLSAYARAGLERIPGPEAPAALRAALNQIKGKRRIGIIHSLGALRDGKAVSTLIQLTRSGDPKVVEASLLALGRIPNEKALATIQQVLTDGFEDHRPDAAAACLLAAESLLEQGKRPDAQKLYDTVRQASVPESYRIAAIRGAILTRQADRILFLMQQIRSDNPAIRDVALLTVRDLAGDELAAALNAELTVAPPDLQVPLILAIADCHNEESVTVIKTKLRSDSPDIRLSALKVLVKIGDTTSASAFLGILQDQPNPEEMALAVQSLESLEGAGVDKLMLEALPSVQRTEARVELIRLLGQRKVVDATGALLREAAQGDTQVQISAFKALRNLAGFDQVVPLIALTKEADTKAIREAAANALYHACNNSLQMDRAGALVLRELKTSSPLAERESWIKVLALLGYDEALPTLRAILQGSDRQLKQVVLTNLRRWPNPAPIETLFTVVGRDSKSEDGKRALMAVFQLATNASNQNQASNKELLDWYQRARLLVSSTQEKRALISGLGRVKDIESIRLLALYLDDPDVMKEAAYAIINAAPTLGKHKVLTDALKKMSTIPDPRLRGEVAKLQRKIESDVK